MTNLRITEKISSAGYLVGTKKCKEYAPCSQIKMICDNLGLNYSVVRKAIRTTGEYRSKKCVIIPIDEHGFRDACKAIGLKVKPYEHHGLWRQSSDKSTWDEHDHNFDALQSIVAEGKK